MSLMVTPPLATAPPDPLWASALCGSPEAWGELFLRHSRAIYNFCFRQTGSWTEAEDLTSAVFLVGWRRRGDAYLTGGSGLPWLYGIAAMLTRNHHRTLRRYHAALARVPPPEPAPDVADEAIARVDAERWLQRFRSATHQLRRRDREVLALAVTGEFTYAEIAAALGVPVGTVKSRLARARQRLAVHLQGWDEPPFEAKA